MEQIGLWAGFILTLMVFSYILGDNILYRLAVYVFVGLAAGYIAVVTWDSVIWPWVSGTVLNPASGLPGIVTGLIPLLLGLGLLLKTSPRFGRAGHISLAFIIGVGTAVALVGAITGTLLPLAASSSGAVSINRVNGTLLVIGVVCTLVYFQYLARRLPDGRTQRRPHIQALALVGQGVIVVTLGALYAAAILTSLTIFSERVGFILARIGGG
ncbi:MAG: hypothetical protein CL610_12300 [Anaerolineaceae bacterium]|nr:hypothetical protein [Anaerolineaceae bacterium]